jgi:hypothetical protein
VECNSYSLSSPKGRAVHHSQTCVGKNKAQHYTKNNVCCCFGKERQLCDRVDKNWLILSRLLGIQNIVRVFTKVIKRKIKPASPTRIQAGPSGSCSRHIGKFNGGTPDAAINQFANSYRLVPATIANRGNYQHHTVFVKRVAGCS